MDDDAVAADGGSIITYEDALLTLCDRRWWCQLRESAPTECERGISSTEADEIERRWCDDARIEEDESGERDCGEKDSGVSEAEWERE